MCLLLAVLVVCTRTNRLPARGKVYLFIGGVAAALLIAEVGARVWLGYVATPAQWRRYAAHWTIPTQEFQWSPHHYLTYMLTPNFKRGKLSHNSRGFRGDEFDVPKPDGLFRIVALGGSTTYTQAVKNNAKTFTAQLERALVGDHRRPSVQVINAGVSGYSSWESLINLEFRVIELEPDLIIVYHGVNESHTRLVKPGTYRSDNSGRRSRWIEPRRTLLTRSAIGRIVGARLGLWEQVGLGSFVTASQTELPRSGDVKPQALEALTAHPPEFFDRNLRSMVAIARAHQFQVVLATWAHTPAINDYGTLPQYVRSFAGPAVR